MFQVVCGLAEQLCVNSESLPHSQIDMIVTEIFDCAFFGEHVLPIMHKTLNSLLSQQSKTIEEIDCVPRRAVVYAVPIESDIVRRSFYFRNDILDEVKLPFVCFGRKDSATYENVMLSSNSSSYKLLSRAVEIFEIDFKKLADSNYLEEFEKPKKLSFQIENNGYFDAIMVYFDLLLSEDFQITTNPSDDQCCKCWGQAIFPASVNSRIIRSNESLEFVVEVDNLTDLSIRTIEFGNFISTNNEIIWTEDSSFISCLNNSVCYFHYLDHILKNKFDQCNENQDNAVLVVLSEPSLVPVYLILSSSVSKVIIYLKGFHQSTLKDFSKFVSFVREKKNVSNDCLKVVESFNGVESLSYRLAYFDLVSRSGKLNQDVLQTYVDLKTILKSSDFIPRKLNVYCRVIESEELLGNNELLKDLHVCGVQMKPYLEMFRKSLFQNIDLQFVSHKYISAAFEKAESFDLSYLNSFDDLTLKYKAKNVKYEDGLSPILLLSYGIQFSSAEKDELQTHDDHLDFKLCGVVLAENSTNYTSQKLENFTFCMNGGMFELISSI